MTADRLAATPTGRTLREAFDALSPWLRRLLVFTTLSVVFLGMLDSTIIGTAMPRIVSQLHGNEDVYTWVVTSYLIASTVTAPLYGRYSDLYGRKPALVLGLALFLAGSLLCGAAGSMTELLIFRTIQGIGAGALIPVSTSLARDAFPLQALLRLQTFMGSMMAVSLIGGPYVGGVLTDLAGWRSVFVVNLVLGIPILAFLAAALPRVRVSTRTGGRPDVLGVVLLTGAVSLILLGLTEKGRAASDGALPSWSSPWVAGYLLGGVALLAAFGWTESRARVPLIPLRLFRIRAYAGILGAAFFFSVAMLPAVLFMPLYFQRVRGVSASTSALLLLPLLAGLVVSNRVCAPLVWRSGLARPVLAAGAVLLGLGSALVLTIGPDSSLILVGVWLALIGLGIGPSMSAVGTLAQHTVSRADIGTGISTLMLVKAVGNSGGLAGGQSVFSQLLAGSAGVALLSRALTDTVGAIGLGGAVLALACLPWIGQLVVRYTES